MNTDLPISNPEIIEAKQFVAPALSFTFCESLRAVAAEIHSTAKDKGWWEKERNDAEMIMLMVTELAEVVEALRHGNPPDDKIPAFKGTEAELADCIIRILDYAHARNLRLGPAIIAKMQMNKGRKYKYGGKQF